MIFMAVFAVLALWELFYPGKPLKNRLSARLLNLSAGLANTLLLRLALPAGLATWANLLEQWTERPSVHWSVGLLLLDLAVYWQHWACHRWPILWRLHAPHHSDDELDLTTGLRFHPLEAICSALWKGAVILIFGISAASALAFETLLAASSLFSHANLRLPHPIARGLSLLWMTPPLHRRHHDLQPVLQKANLGSGMTLWDWLFGTYRGLADRPGPVGLAGPPGRNPSDLPTFLAVPFKINTLQ